MADASLAVLSRNEVISCHRKTDPEPRASKTALDRTTSTAESSSVSQDSRDSGYSSPGRHPISDSQDRVQGDRPSRPKGIAVKLGGQNLFRFKNTTSKPTIARLNYVIDKIEPLLLLVSLKKTGGRVAPMALRTMTLGTNEENAGEYIVVLCPKKLLGTVNDFFDKTKIIQELCEPTEQTPRLSIIVEGREPRLLAKLWHSHLSIESRPGDFCHSFLYNKPTLCGSSLRFEATLTEGKIATFGGMIKVVNMDGQGELYGMTAGHVFNNENMTKPIFEYPEHSPTEVTQESPPGNRTAPRYRILAKDDYEERGPDFDWALVDFGDFAFGPNTTRVNGVEGYINDYLTAESGKFLGDETYQEVEIIRNKAGTCSGLLSCKPARVLLGESNAFTPAYILTLNQGEVGEGDSGAWTVGLVSRDVFGHTVAADMFGDAYVIPLDQTFKDIQRSLGAESVHLALREDFKSDFSECWPSTGLPLEVIHERSIDSGYHSFTPPDFDPFASESPITLPPLVSGLEKWRPDPSLFMNADEDVAPERKAERRRLSTEAFSGETFAQKVVTVEHDAQDMPESNKGDKF